MYMPRRSMYFLFTYIYIYICTHIYCTRVNVCRETEGERDVNVCRERRRNCRSMTTGPRCLSRETKSFTFQRSSSTCATWLVSFRGCECGLPKRVLIQNADWSLTTGLLLSMQTCTACFSYSFSLMSLWVFGQQPTRMYLLHSPNMCSWVSKLRNFSTLRSQTW